MSNEREQKLGRIEWCGVTYDYEAEVEWAFEANYGADADGHRGIPMTFMEDVVVKSVCPLGTDLVMEGANVPDELYEAICDQIAQEEQ